MRLIVRPNADAASVYVAEYIIERILAFAPSPTKPFVLGLPTGSSPLGIYRHLVAAHKQGRISFHDVVTFNMDEYIGLPRDHPESYHSFMWTNFFSHVDVDPANVNILDGNPADGNFRRECTAYEDKIKKVGGIELFLGGVGSDGHVAFNEPGSSLASRTRVKSLAHETRIANARFFGGDISQVPRMALTVGVATVMDAREVVIIATGHSKALAVQQAIEGGVSHMCTLSALQLHPMGLVVVDDAATAEMKVKTVNYFKGVEQTILGDDDDDTANLAPKNPLAVNTVIPTADVEDGELTPDSMSSRIQKSPKLLSVRSATIPFALMQESKK